MTKQSIECHTNTTCNFWHIPLKYSDWYKLKGCMPKPPGFFSPGYFQGIAHIKHTPQVICNTHTLFSSSKGLYLNSICKNVQTANLLSRIWLY